MLAVICEILHISGGCESRVDSSGDWRKFRGTGIGQLEEVLKSHGGLALVSKSIALSADGVVGVRLE